MCVNLLRLKRGVGVSRKQGEDLKVKQKRVIQIEAQTSRRERKRNGNPIFKRTGGRRGTLSLRRAEKGENSQKVW